LENMVGRKNQFLKVSKGETSPKSDYCPARPKIVGMTTGFFSKGWSVRPFGYCSTFE